ncbi:MAG: DUF2156 domain-containing protein [Clostridia bacterium]|nr:DUF2156 domain-containing protein [Clostridia bacterium]
MDFIPFDKEAVAITAPYFAKKSGRLCDWTPAGCYLWSANYTYHYAILHGCLVMQVTLPFGEIYSPPMGEGDTAAALSALEAHCRQANKPLRISPVTPEQATQLTAFFGDSARVKPMPQYADYMYHHTDLATFAGRRYSGQRNHINQFLKKHPNWEYRPLTAELIPSLLRFTDEYLRLKQARGVLSESEEEDMNGVRAVLTAWDALPMSGGVILVDGAVAGFAAGERIGDTLYVHIEKGDTRYVGIYQMLVREYAAHSAAEGLAYINREDDAGEPGLRQSKLAYRPCGMAEKCSVTVERK